MVGTQASLQGSPVSQKGEQQSSLIHEHHVLTSSEIYKVILTKKGL